MRGRLKAPVSNLYVNPMLASTQDCDKSAEDPRSLSQQAAEKVVWNRLPHGRGSVNTCKHAFATMSRARQD